MNIKANQILNNMNEELYNTIYNFGNDTKKYCESIEKKHAWVLNYYTNFCNQFNNNILFPLEKSNTTRFIFFCGKVVQLSFNTIENIIVPSLKRLHKDALGNKFDQNEYDNISDYMKQALQAIKKDPDVIISTKVTEPCLFTDVVEIINAIPEFYKNKACYSSLFLFAVCCGARAISCDGILLKDISYVSTKQEDNKLLYTIDITIQVTKGNTKFKHPVKFRGYLEGDPTDPIYWLNKHLLKEFGLSLSNYHQWKFLNTYQQNKNVKLWYMNADAMREALKQSAFKAGYDKELFCFHSLRSGFICTALMKSCIDKSNVVNVIEATAYVAGWDHTKKTQQLYVKRACKKQIIGNYLVDKNNNKTIIDNDSFKPEVFHQIELKEKQWSSKVNFEGLISDITKYSESICNNYSITNKKDECISNSINYAIININLPLTLVLNYGNIRQYIIKQLKEENNSIYNNYIDQCQKNIDTYYENYKYFNDISINNICTKNTASKHNMPYTKEENELIYKGIAENLGSALLFKRYFNNSTRTYNSVCYQIYLLKKKCRNDDLLVDKYNIPNNNIELYHRGKTKPYTLSTSNKKQKTIDTSREILNGARKRIPWDNKSVLIVCKCVLNKISNANIAKYFFTTSDIKRTNCDVNDKIKALKKKHKQIDTDFVMNAEIQLIETDNKKEFNIDELNTFITTTINLHNNTNKN